MDELFSEERLIQLANMHAFVTVTEATDLIRYFTELAAHVDNELFHEMEHYGIHASELSVTARSSYDPRISREVQRLLKDLRNPSYRTIVEHANRGAKKVIGEINSAAKRYGKDQGMQYLAEIKPRVEPLVNDLLTAAEVVGSGKYQKAA